MSVILETPEMATLLEGVVTPSSSAPTLSVRIAPLVLDPHPSPWGPAVDGDTVSVDMQLIVDYVGALARRAAAAIRTCEVERIEHPHAHPTHVPCLRCAVLGVARYRTMAAVLLEILVRTNADEAWNLSRSCSRSNMMSRLRRLAVSPADMEELLGPWWGEVMLACLRAESADFELVNYLTTNYQSSRSLDVHTRDTMAAYHLATIACPRTGIDGESVSPIVRNAAAVRLAVGVAMAAAGQPPEWLSHLPAPAL